ncbi:hypothetical protein ABB02_02096 [Clostridiaceae bacterium JG1575]|nr:hypothetical protein ABB02_02096 [Clostridiaceae bacterium JG1575]
MNRRKGALISFGTVLFVFVLTTLFFFMVYNLHYDSASDEFSGYIVLGSSYENEPGAQKEMQLGTLQKDLGGWASRNNAILLYKRFSSSGIATIDYSNWFTNLWSSSFNGQTPKTVIVQRTRENLDSYVKDGILFLGVYNYQIVDEFDDKHIPSFQGNAFFYFPMSDITEMEGLLYTNVVDQFALSDLINIIEKSGRSIEPQTYNDKQSSVFKVVFYMLFDGFISRSLLFAFLGITFCAVFAIHMMYRERNKYMAIHHLYGATYRSLLLKNIIIILGLALLGTFLGYLLAIKQLSLIHKSAYLKILLLSGAYNTIFSILLNKICFVEWKVKHSRRVRGN